MEKSLRCDLCGTAQWEWDENTKAYSPIEEMCMGCYYKEIASEDSNDNPGITIRMAPTGTEDHAKHLLLEKRRVKRGIRDV